MRQRAALLVAKLSSDGQARYAAAAMQAAREPSEERFLDEQHGPLLAATLLGALALRVVVLLELRRTIYFRALAPDEQTYHQWAAKLADGADTSGFAPDFARLPALVFAAVYRVFGTDALHIRFLNLALGVAICAVAYGCGRILYGRAAGLLSAALCACSKSLAFYSVTVLNTNLGLFVFGLMLMLGLWLLTAQASSKHRALQFVALGVLAGLVVNLRANAAILIVLVVPLALVGRQGFAISRQALPLLLGFVLAYGVTAAVCGSVRGPQLGFNFYIGNNPDNPTPYFRPVRFTSSAPESQATGFIVEASRRAGHKLSPAGAERFWIDSALHEARERPGDFLGHLARKGLAIVHASPSDNNHDLRMFDDALAALRWLAPSWLLLALGVTAMTLSPLDRRKLAGCAVFALYAATLLAFFAGERLRAPLLLVAAPYAAGGLLELASAVGAQRTRMLWRALSSAAIVTMLAYLPLEGADELSGAYNIRALMLFDAGDLDGADRWYRRSLSLDELDSPGARIGLAAILEKRGQHAEAVEMLQALPDSHYEAASKYEWLGNLALGAGRARDALRAYETSLEIDSSRQNAYKGLYIAHRLLGETAEASAADDRLRYLQSFH